jgi:hypothetical protein
MEKLQKIKGFLQKVGILKTTNLDKMEKILNKGKTTMYTEEKKIWEEMTPYEKELYIKKYYREDY